MVELFDRSVDKMDDIVNFMQRLETQMKINHEAVNENIKRSNESLGKEIKNEIAGIKDKIKEVSDEVAKNKNDADNKFLIMETRLEDIVKENSKFAQLKRKRDVLPRKENEKEISLPNVAIQPAGSSYADRARTDPMSEQLDGKQGWARQVSQLSLEQQLRQASEAATRMEESNAEPVQKMKQSKKKILLGNSAELHDDTDWPWDMGEHDWDGTEDRVQRNKVKKEKERRRRRKRIEKAALVGQCTVGIGPIVSQSINYFNRITGDYSVAKKLAAAEFMTEYLKFNHDDLSDIDITDTKVSSKGDDILYVVLDSPSKAQNIRRRIASCRNPAIKQRDYIPPQFFKRYGALSKYAKEMRDGDSGVKTQIRFGTDDIALFTKTRGTEDAFQMVDMSQITLPQIEHNAAWTRHSEHPPWRQVSPEVRTVKLKSLGGLDRISSGSQDLQPSNKKHKDLNADSSKSNDEHDSPSSQKSQAKMNISDI